MIGVQYRTQVGVAAVLLATALYSYATDGTAPLDDFSPDKTRFIPGLALTELPRIAWHFTAPSSRPGSTPGLSDPAAANGMLFFGDDLGMVRALTAKHGVKIWSHEHGERVFNPPISDGERLYVTSRRGIAALSVDTGRLVWERPIEGGAGRCVVRRDTVFCAGSDGWAYALEAQTGVERWICSITDEAPEDPPGFPGERARFDNTAARPTGIATDGRFVYFSVFDQSRVMALNCESGAKRWSFQTGGWIYGDPAVDDRHLYVGSQDKHFYCLDKMTGKLLWKHATNSRIESGPAVDEIQVYIPSCDGSVYCLQKQTGVLRWKFTVAEKPRPTAIYSAPIVGRDSLYIAAAEGHVFALRKSDGALRWTLQPAENSHLYTCPANRRKSHLRNFAPRRWKPRREHNFCSRSTRRQLNA